MTKLGLVCALLASACATKNDGALSRAQAKVVGDSIGTSVEASAALFGPLDQTANADGPPCVTVSGDPTDDDMDNIPVNGTLTYACTATALGLTGMLTGTLAVTDDQPAVQAWAFTGTADLHASLAGGGSSITVDRAGSIVATQGTTIGPFSLAHDLDQVTEIVVNNRTTTITEAATWELAFTPMVAWTPGSLVVTGGLDASGTWALTVGDTSADATLATPQALTLDPACATLVTGGTITATYSDTAHSFEVITVTWTGCGVHTVTRS